MAKLEEYRSKLIKLNKSITNKYSIKSVKNLTVH